ncbi:MAG: hypothetical protein ACKVRN_03825 [Pyrinomonadaceae bacterium]
MNSEELELSLRSEFENYLKSFRAEMREQAAELQKRVEAEMDKHRSLLDEAFQSYAARFDTDQQIDEGFKASVVEHLRQARDEGAALAASAMAETAKFDEVSAPAQEVTPVAAPADYGSIRDAVAEISQHRSQATILKSLVEQAEKFAPRGAFFIVKNEHFEGWKAFGDDSADNAVRDIRFPTSADTILGKATETLSTTSGSHGERSHDESFLIPLNYGQPDRMHALPLVARGRGVAVLYADYGSGGSVNVEALETLMRVAGLTVEMLASSAQTAKVEARETTPADAEEAKQEQVHDTQPEVSHEEASHEEVSHEEVSHEEVSHEVAYDPDAKTAEFRDTDFAFTESEPAEQVQEVETPFSEHVEAAPATEESREEAVSETEVSPVEEEVTAFEPDAEFDSEQESGEVIFDAPETEAEHSPFDSSPDFEPAGAGVGIGGKKNKKGREKAVDISPANVGRATRTSARSAAVDLPIEVSEEERRPHNDARRFARLLVSEIKLYNEQRVIEGRQQGDLYGRLREAIDRSREMYDKRVQPPVAQKFDYFHFELVNTLADGNADRFGAGYPGASV